MGCASLYKPKLKSSIFETHTSRIYCGKSKRSALPYIQQFLCRKNLTKIFRKHKSRMSVIYEVSMENESEFKTHNL